MNSEGIIAKYVWSADPETKKSTSAGAFFLIAKRFIELHKGQVAVYEGAPRCRRGLIIPLNSFVTWMKSGSIPFKSTRKGHKKSTSSK